MYLSHQALVIRDARESDCAQLAAWWNDGRVMAHAGFPNGLGTTEEKIWRDIRTDSDTTRRRLMVECGGAPIGEMCYAIRCSGTAEIGIKICEAAYQEKGYGRILLSMLIAALFERGFEKIVLDTDPENTRAQHVYALLGFERQGIRRDSWTDQLGRRRSAVDYAMTPEQFRDWRGPETT